MMIRNEETKFFKAHFRVYELKEDGLLEKKGVKIAKSKKWSYFKVTE